MVRPRSTVGVLLVLVAAMAAASSRPQVALAQESAPEVDVTASSTRKVLDQFCVRCHNDRTLVAGLALDTKDLTDVSAEAEAWERVIVKLRAQTMPPAGAPKFGWYSRRAAH